MRFQRRCSNRRRKRPRRQFRREWQIDRQEPGNFSWAGVRDARRILLSTDPANTEIGQRGVVKTPRLVMMIAPPAPPHVSTPGFPGSPQVLSLRSTENKHKVVLQVT